MIKEVHKHSGKPLDVGQLVFLAAVNATMRMLWGNSLKAEEGTNFGAQFRKVMAEIIVLMAKPNVSDFFPALARFDLQGIERKAKRMTLWCEQVLNSAMEGRLNWDKENKGVTNNDHRDFLQFFSELVDHEDGTKSITKAQFRATLMDIVVGGTDTSATTVEWAMAELMHHPDIREKVVEELTTVVGLDNMVEESHLPQLHWLDAVVKETLRLHPALPLLLPRRPSTIYTVGGHTIPEGTKVFINAWAIHRDPQLWDNPLEFQPQRFMGQKFDFSGNNCQYIPFGLGRRICAGIPLAEKMVGYMLASLLHSFDWKLVDGTEMDFAEKFGVVVKKVNPVVAVPTPRLSKPEFYI